MCIIIFINACTKPLPYLLLAFAHSLQYHFELFILLLDDWWSVQSKRKDILIHNLIP